MTMGDSNSVTSKKSSSIKTYEERVEAVKNHWRPRSQQRRCTKFRKLSSARRGVKKVVKAIIWKGEQGLVVTIDVVSHLPILLLEENKNVRYIFVPSKTRPGSRRRQHQGSHEQCFGPKGLGLADAESTHKRGLSVDKCCCLVEFVELLLRVVFGLDDLDIGKQILVMKHSTKRAQEGVK